MYSVGQVDDEPFNPDYVEIDRILDVSTGVDQSTGAVFISEYLAHVMSVCNDFHVCLFFQPVSHYLIKWRSLPYDESTWEVEVCLV